MIRDGSTIRAAGRMDKPPLSHPTTLTGAEIENDFLSLHPKLHA